MALIFCGAASSSAFAPAAAASAGLDEAAIFGSVIARIGGFDSRPGKTDPSRFRIRSMIPPSNLAPPVTPRNCQSVSWGQQGWVGVETLTVVPLAAVVGGRGAAGVA